ncbi:2-methyl-6-phytyl-1,4-hydroquinone methyltransferase [subsurface metagenome]
MTQNQIKKYYNECYGDYNRVWHAKKNLAFHYGFHNAHHRGFDEALIHMNSVLADRAKIKSADTVLDAGCGIGGSSIWLAKNIGCQVIGVDINDKLLQIARRLAKEKSVDRLVSFYTRDFCNTGLPANSLDVVWTLESMCHAEDKKVFLTEARRILKPGGTLVIADGFLNQPLDDKMRGYLDGWAVPNLISDSLFYKWLLELHFRNINFTDITKNIMPSSNRLYVAGLAMYPIGKILEWIGVRTRVQTRNIEAAIFQHKALRQGLCKYGIFVAQRGIERNDL